jgi:CHAT domain-containing protein/tetratricopeptide (TPR) repeat protein
MKFAYQVGLALLVNLAIIFGGMLPGVGVPSHTLISQQQESQAQQAVSNGLELMIKGSESSFRQAILLFEQALKYSQTEKNLPLQASTLSYLGQAYSSLNQEQKALEYYNQSLNLYNSTSDQVNAARLLRLIGSSYETLGNKQKALGYYEQALPIFVKNNTINIGTELPTIATLQSIGAIYIEMGQQQQGLDFYIQALAVAQNSGVVGIRPWIVDALSSLIDVCLQIDEKVKAIDYAEQALAQLEGVRNPTRKGKIFYRAGLAYARSNYHHQALEYFEKALPIQQTAKDQAGEAIMLAEMASAAYGAGKAEKAIEYGTTALPMLQAVKRRQSESAILNSIGLSYSILGEQKKALDYLNQSLPIAQAIGDKQLEATVLSNMGLVYGILGMSQEALKYYEQSLPMRRASGDKSGEAATLNNMANIYLVLSNDDAALKSFNQSLALSRSLTDRGGEAITLLNISSLYTKKDSISEALKYCNQALSIFQTLGVRSGEANAMSRLASINRAQNKLTDALQNINAAIEIVESLRSELKNDALKTSYFTSVQGYYQLKTAILMQLHQQQPTKGYDAAALENTDQSRARVLRELLIQANANINKDISPALLKQEQTLNQTLNAKETQLVQLASQSDKVSQLTALNQEIATLYAQRDDLKNTIRLANPAYANLQYPKTTTLAQIQQQLDPDTLMLQYSLGETESYLWVIGQTTLKTYILPKRADIEKTIAIFRKELNAQLTAPNSAITLSQQLIAPAAPQLGNKRLVIIPDGLLHTIPFAALNTPNSTTYKPLLTQHEITNLPSASTISILRTTVATKPRGPKTLAILADPIFTKDDDRMTGKTLQASNNMELDEQRARDRAARSLEDIHRLPATATEAKGILALVPNQDSTSAFGFDASYDWITSPKISQYRYALSSIILSSFDAQGNDRRAFLRFPELFNLNLPTELVILSACETGLGNNVPGEGLVGMTRGLMYAGALRVGVSLWKVDDQATSDLMQDFYKNLWQSKQSHASSLRAAQLKMWNQGKAPYYWAAFTLQGEWRN